MPELFTDPFRYVPHASVRYAAAEIIRHIDSDAQLSAVFSEGKMLGVLVCTSTDKPGKLCYLAAFSGNVGGQSHIEGFVPPIYDLMNPDGYFKKGEAEITAINLQIQAFGNNGTIRGIKEQLTKAENDKEKELEQMRSSMAISKARREKLRLETEDSSVLAQLVRQSQHEKAEFRRLRISWDKKIREIESQLDEIRHTIDSLKRQRASMSDSLQKWIFQQYKVHNASGECSTIAALFEDQGLVPPGGTGECAAPKLLEHAYRNSLIPLAMGEFWYGKPSGTAVRTHGRFYPSCTSKCGPLLGYMLKGLSVGTDYSLPDMHHIAPAVIYEDSSIIVVEKPGGMPSVPGLDGRLSLQEWLTEREQAKEASIRTDIHAVHRLDMDTSGVMIFARTHDASVSLRRQFEEHSVCKTYMARLCPAGQDNRDALQPDQTGAIDLPLSPDYDERPRQKVDMNQGKPAHTEYKVISANADGITDLLLYPRTGRTHQLRVHCAHSLGLSRPIVGDLLYGAYDAASGTESERLYLHALSITFIHPLTGEALTYTASNHAYSNL